MSASKHQNMTALAINSEVAIGNSVNQHLNLYGAVSNHEKRLLPQRTVLDS